MLALWTLICQRGQIIWHSTAPGQMLHPIQLAIALLNGIVYFALGLFLFRWAELETKRRGRLGGY